MLISINLVLVDSSDEFIRNVLQDIKGQSYTNYEFNILYNGLNQKLVEKLHYYKFGNTNIYQNKKVPTGFCENHNYLIRKSKGEVLLILNPDLRLNEDFIINAINYFQNNSNAGFIAPKLYQMSNDSNYSETQIIDSSGMRLNIFQRHLDINSNQLDPSNDIVAYVWGATGAAFFVRKNAIQSIILSNGNYFDERFYMGREDADLSYRLRLMGWHCLYVPDSVGYHKRTTLPNNRRSQSKLYNYHQVKNRFILRFNNISVVVLILLFIPFILRDISIFIYCVLFERHSLKAFLWVIKNYKSLFRIRKEIQNNRVIGFRKELSWYFIKYRTYKEAMFTS